MFQRIYVVPFFQVYLLRAWCDWHVPVQIWNLTPEKKPTIFKMKNQNTSSTPPKFVFSDFTALHTSSPSCFRLTPGEEVAFPNNSVSIPIFDIKNSTCLKLTFWNVIFAVLRCSRIISSNVYFANAVHNCHQNRDSVLIKTKTLTCPGPSWRSPGDT